MRALIFSIVSFLFFSCVSTPVFYNVKPIKRNSNIAVLPFTDFRTKNNSGQLIANIFLVQLMKNNFKVIERESINQILNEKKSGL